MITLHLRLNNYGLLNLLFPLKFHPTTLERPPNYLKCPSDSPLKFPHQSFLVQFSSQPFESSFPFYRVFDFFLWFLKYRVFDEFIQFKSCIKSASHYFYGFNKANLTVAIYHMNMGLNLVLGQPCWMPHHNLKSSSSSF